MQDLQERMRKYGGSRMDRIVADFAADKSKAAHGAEEEEEEDDDDDEGQPPPPTVTYRTTMGFLSMSRAGGDPTLAQPSGFAQQLLRAAGCHGGAGGVASAQLLRCLQDSKDHAVTRATQGWPRAALGELISLLEEASAPALRQSVASSAWLGTSSPGASTAAGMRSSAAVDGATKGYVSREALRKYCVVAWLFGQMDEKHTGSITAWELQKALMNRADVAREIGVPPQLSAALMRCIAHRAASAGSFGGGGAGARATLRDFWTYYAPRRLGVFHHPINTPAEVSSRLLATSGGAPATLDTLSAALADDQELCLEMGWTPASAAAILRAADAPGGRQAQPAEVEHVCTVRWAWSRLDTSHDGFIAPCELGDALQDERAEGLCKALRVRRGDAAALCSALDPERTGEIRWDTFLAHFRRQRRADARRATLSASMLCSRGRLTAPTAAVRKVAARKAAVAGACAALGTAVVRQLAARAGRQPTAAKTPEFAKSPGDKYVKKKEIGQGSFGRVFLMERVSDGLLLVAKEPLPVVGGKTAVKANRRRMLKVQREAAQMMILKHPNVLRFVEAYWDTGRLIIITEYCDGGDLSGWLARKRTTAKQAERLKIFAQMAAALAYLHECDVLHRDLKPANVLLHGKQNIVKLADFGVARALLPGEAAKTLCGTELYMAPEVHQRQPYGPACDVFSMGCILHQLATGKRAFQTVGELVSCQRRGVQTPAYCKNLLDAMLSKDPAKRPPAGELMNWLPLGRLLRMRARLLGLVWGRREAHGGGASLADDDPVLRIFSFILFSVPHSH